MRLVTGAMRNAKRSPSASVTSSVVVAAGRPAVSRENLVEAVIPCPLAVRGAAPAAGERQLGWCDGETRGRTAPIGTTLRRSDAAKQAPPRPRGLAGDGR